MVYVSSSRYTPCFVHASMDMKKKSKTKENKNYKFKLVARKWDWRCDCETKLHKAIGMVIHSTAYRVAKQYSW